MKRNDYKKADLKFEEVIRQAEQAVEDTLQAKRLELRRQEKTRVARIDSNAIKSGEAGSNTP